MAPPPPTRHEEPHWQDAFGDTPELLVVLRPAALKQDKVYGGLLRRVTALARERNRVASATPLDAMQDADEVVIGVNRDRRGGENAAPQSVWVVLGVRADIDPLALVDSEGRALWSPGPAGPVRELVRERDEHGSPIAASLFELPGRAWLIATGDARVRARESFAHPFGKPPIDLDPQALAVVRVDGPSLVAHFPALQTLGRYAAIGRRLQALTIRVPPSQSGEVESVLAYADEDAAAFAEITARQAVLDLASLAGASVDRKGRKVVVAPLSPALVEALMKEPPR